MAKTSNVENDPSNTVQVHGDEADRPRLIAELAVTPSLQGAATIRKWSHVAGDLDISGLIDELQKQAATALTGDLKRQEAMLAIQAHTLDTIFNELARRSWSNVNGGYVEAGERYMRLALKAQSQSRATIETLSEMKNPKPVAFVQQANIANGPQQVNNENFETNTRTRAENSEIQQNKLLEKQDGERLEFGATGQAVGGDSTMATVETIDRPADG
jgi:hypothetical protein